MRISAKWEDFVDYNGFVADLSGQRKFLPPESLMFRFISILCLSYLFLCSVGCRMCNTPYDYCISTHIERPDDFRGCGHMYRAGSILGGDGNNICQTAYFERGNLYNNAGNYGDTAPISSAYTSSPHEPRQRSRQNTIAVPQDNPEAGGWISDPRDRLPDDLVPSVEDLINRRRETTPIQIPLSPPGRPRVTPMPDDSTIESTPFSPSDAITPPPQPGVLPMKTDELPITLEELQRLDPTVRDVQIISIEDAADALFR